MPGGQWPVTRRAHEQLFHAGEVPLLTESLFDRMDSDKNAALSRTELEAIVNRSVGCMPSSKSSGLQALRESLSDLFLLGFSLLMLVSLSRIWNH